MIKQFFPRLPTDGKQDLAGIYQRWLRPLTRIGLAVVEEFQGEYLIGWWAMDHTERSRLIKARSCHLQSMERKAERIREIGALKVLNQELQQELATYRTETRAIFQCSLHAAERFRQRFGQGANDWEAMNILESGLKARGKLYWQGHDEVVQRRTFLWGFEVPGSSPPVMAFCPCYREGKRAGSVYTIATTLTSDMIFHRTTKMKG